MKDANEHDEKKFFTDYFVTRQLFIVTQGYQLPIEVQASDPTCKWHDITSPDSRAEYQ